MTLTRQVLRFGVTGLINTAIGLAVIMMLHLGAGLSILVSNAVGYATGLLVSFILNHRWTFTSVALNWRTAWRFFITIAASYGISMMVIITFRALNVCYLAAQFMGVFTYSLISFLGMRNFVFAAKY